MQPTSKTTIARDWGRFTLWASHHQHIARLVSLTLGLIVFFFILPPYMRTVFWNGLKTHQILASMLLVFSLLAVSVIWSAGQQFDAWGFLLLNVRGPRPIWLDQLMLGVTQIGNGITGLGIALFFWLVKERLLAYELALGILTLWLVVELVKLFVNRARPFILLTQSRIVGRQAFGRSFPSGHTSQVFFMATLMAEHFHSTTWVVFLLYTLALLVGITRMYVGAHYPRDVLAGAILGSAWGLLGVLADGYVFIGFK